MKHFILGICSLSSLFSQKSNIDQIFISTKINGVSVKLGLDNPLDSEFVTAWFDSKTNWFYITAYQASGDKRVLEQTKKIEPIYQNFYLLFHQVNQLLLIHMVINLINL